MDKDKKKYPFWKIATERDGTVNPSELDKLFREGDKKMKDIQKNKKNQSASLNQTFDGKPE